MTSDKFSDIWIPFYKLFEKYWGNCSFRIFHISENNLPSTFLSINHISINSNLTWCEKLSSALDKVNSKYVLLLLSDYYLLKKVNENLINHYLEVLEKNDAAFLRIFPCPGPHLDYNNYSDIGLITKNTEYSISTQATIWNKSDLKEFIANYNNDSELEIYGSLNSNLIKKDLLSVKVINNNKELENENYAFTYLCTAVVQGKWNRKVKSLLNKENINISNLNRKRQSFLEYFYYYNYLKIPRIIRKLYHFLFIRK